MPEKETLNVFICGNYKAAASREETDILKLIENVIQSNGDTVINHSLLRSNIEPENSIQRARIVSAYRLAVMQTDCGYADITVPRLFQAAQIRIIQNVAGASVWSSAKEGSEGDGKKVERIARYPRQEGWAHPRELAEYVRTCLSMSRAIKEGRRNRTLAQLYFDDIPGIDNPDTYDPTQETITINGLKYRLVPVIEEKQTPGYIRTGNLAIDAQYRRVLHRVTQIPLDRIEYTILEMLAQKPGEPFNRAQIKKYCMEQLQKSNITDETFQENCAHASYKVNKLESPARRYIDVNKGEYRLRQYQPDTYELPELADNGNLHVDFTNERVWLDREAVVLGTSGTRFTLFLAERIGQVLKKAEIIERVWQGKKVRDPQYSEQVRRLKEKFGDAKKEPDGLILHERGTVAMVRKRNTA